MPGWIIAAAIASIAVTAILTFVLWRVNRPMLDRNKRDDGGGDSYVAAHSDGGRRDADHGSDGGSDGGGGGDGGGD